MNKVLYSIMANFPIIGSFFKFYTKPMFCSPGSYDGHYDNVLSQISKYQHEHPNEVVTKQLLEKLIKDRSNVKKS